MVEINRILTKAAYYIVSQRFWEKLNFAERGRLHARKVFQFLEGPDNRR
jgi:hypothetical protein